MSLLKKDQKEPFGVVIVVPPYSVLRVNDVSVLQALGFDSVNQPDDAQSIMYKEHPASECHYSLENNTAVKKVFRAKRMIRNTKMSGL